MDTFKLPSSSYEELVKIIKAYGKGKVGNPVSLDDLMRISGMGKTILSKNNAFLMQVGLITKGAKKAPTETCYKLANSYEMNLKEKTTLLWRQLCNNSDFLSNMISVVSVKGKMTKTEYVNHILYSANCGNGSNYKAGAAAIIEIFKIIDAIVEEDGEIRVQGTTTIEQIKEDAETKRSGSNKKEGDASPDESIDVSFYVQQYTCESGQIAKIIIPDNATKDDLLGFRDMLNIALKRRFKINGEE